MLASLAWGTSSLQLTDTDSRTCAFLGIPGAAPIPAQCVCLHRNHPAVDQRSTRRIFEQRLHCVQYMYGRRQVLHLVVLLMMRSTPLLQPCRGLAYKVIVFFLRKLQSATAAENPVTLRFRPVVSGLAPPVVSNARTSVGFIRIPEHLKPLVMGNSTSFR